MSRGLIARTQLWVAPEQQDDQAPLFPTLPASGFDPSFLDDDWDDDGQTRPFTYSFNFAAISTGGEQPPLPSLTVATIDQRAALWQEQPGQELPVIALWHTPDAAHAPPILTVLYPLDPSLTGDLWHDHSHQQARSVVQTWFAPDAEAAVPQPPVTSFDPATVEWGESDPQQLRPFGHATQPTWETGGEKLPATPPTTPFNLGYTADTSDPLLTLTVSWSDPAGWGSVPVGGRLIEVRYSQPTENDPVSSSNGFGTVYYIVGVGLASELFSPFLGAPGALIAADHLSVRVWFRALGDLGGGVLNGDWVSELVPPAALKWWAPLEQAPLPDQTQRWFAPEASSEGFVPISGGPTPPTTDQLAGLWQDQTVQQLPVPWLFADNILGINGTPAFDPATMDFGYDAQQGRDQTTRWFAPDESEWHPTATGDGPAPGGFSAALVGGGWDAQTDRDRTVRWFQPAEEWHPTATGNGPAPGGFDPATMDFGYDAQQDRATQATWFAPDENVQGIPPFNPTTANVAQQAALWPDASGQQDRSLRQTWVHPPDATEVVYPTLPVGTFASIDQRAALWTEQPYPLAGNRPVWYHPAVEPVDGPLQDWLFTTSSPGGGAPAILIDATTGDVFLSIGGPFIVPAT